MVGLSECEDDDVVYTIEILAEATPLQARALELASVSPLAT